jgi:hypothetical protein
MRIHNLYEDANGESHFRDVEVDWVEETPSGKMSNRLPATGIVFRETTADYENSWHRAPRRQYVISLAGGISITASDGETRRIGAGEVVLVEDTTGKGHITRSWATNRATRSSCRSIDRAGGATAGGNSIDRAAGRIASPVRFAADAGSYGRSSQRASYRRLRNCSARWRCSDRRWPC